MKRFFRIAREGATCDGRNIPREWLEQMAKNYNPKIYGARINLEHIKGLLPDGIFKRFGDVEALKTEEEDGVMFLLAALDPTEDLKTMTANKQKVYTSIEVNPKFADSGEAYLVGLAVTDDPASLGTEMLAFCASATVNPLTKRKQNAENFISEAFESEFDFTNQPAAEQINFFQKIKAMFASNTKMNAEQEQAIEFIATQLTEQNQEIELQNGTIAELQNTVETLSTDMEQLTEQFKQLTAKPEEFTPRPEANGSEPEQPILTVC